MSLQSFSRGLLLASALVATAGAPAAAQPQPPAPHAVTLTADDVDASNGKVRMAYGALATMWRDEFGQLGARFATPRLVRYRTAVRTACGVMRAGNAGYCAADNGIYYDDLFVAGLARRAAGDLGTDGDMAAVGVIAHEVGHAVAMQLGLVSRFTYANESVADCLAGAFARQARDDGSIESGDLEEAFWGMSAAGDPAPRLTGDRRADRAIVARAALMGHGTERQRMANFRAGLDGGARVCLTDFRAAA